MRLQRSGVLLMFVITYINFKTITPNIFSWFDTVVEILNVCIRSSIKFLY